MCGTGRLKNSDLVSALLIFLDINLDFMLPNFILSQNTVTHLPAEALFKKLFSLNYSLSIIVRMHSR